jgi:tripartite-type tricarboxylate transporter receptor subunit TctC
LGGRISLIFAPIPTVAGLIKANQVKALATTSIKRTSVAPDLPTLAESGLANFDATIWYGLVGPRNLPPQIVAAISKVTNSATKTTEVESSLRLNGADPYTSTPEEFAAFIQHDIAKWKEVADSAGISVE